MRPCLNKRTGEYRKFLEDLSSDLAHCHSALSFGQGELHNQVQAESEDARPPTKRSRGNTVLQSGKEQDSRLRRALKKMIERNHEVGGARGREYSGVVAVGDTGGDLR